MTEQEWNVCTDWGRMLNFLRGKASERKLRLFAVACCRRIWPACRDDPSWETLVVFERYADGDCTREQLQRARRAAEAAMLGYTAEDGNRLLRGTEGWGDWPDRHRLRKAVRAAGRTDAFWATDMAAASLRWGWTGQEGLADLLRELFGPLPFRGARIDPGWLTWNAGTVRRLAEAAYDERSGPEGTLGNDRLAVLADALEEAGCSDAELLGHLRGSGPHVRGCWVVDLLLDKE